LRRNILPRGVQINERAAAFRIRAAGLVALDTLAEHRQRAASWQQTKPTDRDVVAAFEHFEIRDHFAFADGGRSSAARARDHDMGAVQADRMASSSERHRATRRT
jgi:hypothetical protein